MRYIKSIAIFASQKLNKIPNLGTMANKNEEEEKDPRDVLYNYVSTAKFSAFTKRYKPCDDPGMADRTFTDSELRKYFNAYRVPAGDPLVLYLDELLGPADYNLVDDGITGEPVLCVCLR